MMIIEVNLTKIVRVSEFNATGFDASVVTAVTGHMNGDHPEDNLMIVQALGGAGSATAATMTGYNEDGATFDANVDGENVAVTVPWAEPILERATIRHEVVRMYNEACAILGVTPRGEGDH